jgi:hypothetical protein
MKEILLSNKGRAIVDDEDFDLLNQWSWYQTGDGYATRSVWKNGKLSRIWMHRVVLGIERGLCDHINRDKLDNRRSNLRRATARLNSLNARPAGAQKTRNSWTVCVGKPALYIGCFPSKEFALAISAFVRASLIYQEVAA